MTPIDQTRCPLCARPNECGMAAGKDSCWCTEVKIPAAILEKIPAEAKNLACVCRACAASVPRENED